MNPRQQAAMQSLSRSPLGIIFKGIVTFAVIVWILFMIFKINYYYIEIGTLPLANDKTIAENAAFYSIVEFLLTVFIRTLCLGVYHALRQTYNEYIHDMATFDRSHVSGIN
jgi:uncharacterized membrane protein YiaA